MRIKQGFKIRTVGTEHIVTGEGLAQINFNKLISLNASAAFLWKEIEGKEFDIQFLANLLVSKYNITLEQALKDALEITNSWIEVGIVEK